MALGRLSKCFRSLYEPSKEALCGFLHSGRKKSCVQVKRHLLTEDVIKLHEFQQRKCAVAHLITGKQGNFIERIRMKLQSKNLILEDELKLFLHLCQTPDDMEVARDAIYRYHSDNSKLSYGNFVFGPLFMRLCYELSLEEMAAAAITDKTLKGFFNDTTSFNIALDMLFLKGAYENAVEVLRTMKIYRIPLNKHTHTLACGIFYKLNTPESYKTCTSFLKESQTKGFVFPRHAYCFAMALALRQNDTKMAQHLLSNVANTEGTMCTNLKVLILAKSEMFKEVTSVLVAALHQTPSFIKKHKFSQEVVDLLRVQCQSGPYTTEIIQLLSRIEQAGQVIQLTLDDLLCHTPAGKPQILLIMDDAKKTKHRQNLKLLKSVLLCE